MEDGEHAPIQEADREIAHGSASTTPTTVTGKRREVTSAVPGMPVATMRKHLAVTRGALVEQTPLHPFTLNAELEPGLPVWKFVHLVATGLHRKRTSSRARDKSRGAAGCGARDDAEDGF